MKNATKTPNALTASRKQFAAARREMLARYGVTAPVPAPVDHYNVSAPVTKPAPVVTHFYELDAAR